jgi:hypothetical protein
MMSIREMTEKGDPMIRIMLSEEMHGRLVAAAKENKRRPQDEFIKRMSRSLSAEFFEPEICAMAAENPAVKLIQVISAEMMDELKYQASSHGVTVDHEVGMRLFATFDQPHSFGLDCLSERILRQKFSASEAMAECKQNHLAWLYPYEIKKLRLLLSFQGKIPATVKEVFTVIDVKAETKKILAELKADGEQGEGGV